MTEVVVEVGPATVVGPNSVDANVFSVGLDCIDDEIVLIDEQPVAVDALWRSVLCSAVGPDADTAVVVCPAWWSTARRDLVKSAAESAAATVMMLERTQVLLTAAPGAVIVESTTEFAVVTRKPVTTYVAWSDGPGAVLAAIGITNAVVIDGQGPGAALTVEIGNALREAGVVVTYTDRDSVRRAVTAARSRDRKPPPADRREKSGRRFAALAGVVSVVVLCGGFAIQGSDVSSTDVSMTYLVEGGITAMVPTTWRLQRITSGPGSARLQLNSPTDGNVALHITHAVGVARDIAATAESLRAALDDEPDGAFVDFKPVDQRAGRQAVTYREVRGDSQIEWVVIVDGSVRIAIGCQSPRGGEHLVRQVCDEAIRSAHVAT